ncbi:pheromone-regulated protein prm10 [Coemansia sp. RSA 2336]|nr:pheromone-regulated protein prm10 [Coemansia sp. RSA 2336]
MRDGALEHDPPQLAAVSDFSQTRTVSARHQWPLQIHLDVAAVEHDTNEPGDTQQHQNDEPGLLSHYLQLVEIERQCSHRNAQSLHNCFKRSSKRSTANPTDPKEAHTRQAHNHSPSPDHADSLLSRFPDGQVQASTASNTRTNLTATNTSRTRNAAGSNLQMPLNDMDLTRFLPYALSTPGIQSVLGSSSLSRENSVENMADLLKRKGHLFGAAMLTDTTDEPQDPEVLDDRRGTILHGIHRLLLHQQFICLLARALMQFGAPLHHLEDNLTRISRHLHIVATFTTMPGLVLISIEDTTTSTSETKIIRCPNGYDMHRLDLTDNIVRSVSRETISVEEGTRQLNEIMSMPPLFAWYWQLLNWGAASWSVCLLAFNGSWYDSLAALVLGLMGCSLNLLAGRLKGYTNLFEVSVSILCGFMASIFERWVCFPAVTLSATVVLLPGLTLTTGVIELASRNIHAGTIRIGYALMLVFIIAFGINLGNDLFVEIFSKPDRTADMNISTCSAVSLWWWWLALPVAAMSICLLVNVHPRNWHACILASGAMAGVFWALAIHLQLKTIGPVVAAFVLGLVANVWGKIFRHNAYAIMLPGFMILVQGSMGVRGIVAMFSSNEIDTSLQLVSQMAQSSLGIMVGLFASSLVVYPHGKKLSALITV